MIKALRLVAFCLLALGLARSAAAALFEDWFTVAIAASHNSIEEVLAVLTHGGADPDVVDSTGGRTALDYAASFNNVQMAKVLLDYGAHVDGRDPAGGTALHWAAERGNLEVMRLLIADKATVDAANREGVTPLMSAASHTQPGAVRLLLANGADPKKQDYTGRDAFGWATGKPAVMQALNAKR